MHRIVFNNKYGDEIGEIKSDVIPQAGNSIIIPDAKKQDRRYKVYHVEIVYVYDETTIYVTVI